MRIDTGRSALGSYLEDMCMKKLFLVLALTCVSIAFVTTSELDACTNCEDCWGGCGLWTCADWDNDGNFTCGIEGWQ